MINIPENGKVRVQKANRAMYLPWHEAENYLKMGYTVYNLSGEIIAEPDTYKSELREARKEIARLTAELDTAKRENALLTRKLKRSRGEVEK